MMHSNQRLLRLVLVFDRTAFAGLILDLVGVIVLLLFLTRGRPPKVVGNIVARCS